MTEHQALRDVVGEPRHPATGRFIRGEELREPLFTKDHKVRGHVDGRVINAGLSVDHPADALRVVDEHMAHVEIAMHHHGEIWPRRIVVEPALLPPVEALGVHHELASDAVTASSATF